MDLSSFSHLLAQQTLSAGTKDALGNANLLLDFVLVAASVWMVFVVRGIGGVVGRTLSWIIAGAIVLGVAHLVASFASNVLEWDATFNNFIHRLIVLLGFVLLVYGFRQIRVMKA